MSFVGAFDIDGFGTICDDRPPEYLKFASSSKTPVAFYSHALWMSPLKSFTKFRSFPVLEERYSGFARFQAPCAHPHYFSLWIIDEIDDSIREDIRRSLAREGFIELFLLLPDFRSAGTEAFGLKLLRSLPTRVPRITRN